MKIRERAGYLVYWLDNLWRWKSGMPEKQLGVPPVAELEKTEWSPLFMQYMRNRLLMGAYRYGLLGDKIQKKWDHIGSIRKRLDLYENDGNLEHLVDIANICMAEFMCMEKRGAKLESVDDLGAHIQEVI